jgi:hypothetical protein
MDDPAEVSIDLVPDGPAKAASAKHVVDSSRPFYYPAVTMRTPRRLVTFLAGSILFAANGRALAFGGTADRLGQQGNFVITNEASVGFEQRLNDPTGTSFTLQPAVQYFFAQNVSFGGSVLFGYSNSGGQSATQFGVAPELGYHVPLSETWSFWPGVSLGFTTFSASPGTSSTSAYVSIHAPFLIHPAEHFFFGAGPGLSLGLAGDNKVSAIEGSFVIGGYFAN